MNSAGATLSQADFAMSKIAANETYGGNHLRKAIDYFCHLAVAPEFHGRSRRTIPAFAASEYFPKMRGSRTTTTTSMTRPTRTCSVSRSPRSSAAASSQDLVALLSGRNFETKQYEEADRRGFVRSTAQGVLELHQPNPLQAVHDDPALGRLRDQRLIGCQNALNFAYIIYLRGRAEAPAGRNRKAGPPLVRRCRC